MSFAVVYCCFCWHVPASMLDPNALGTAFDIHWQLVHSVTFIEHFSGPQGRRRCLAAGVLDIWHGTDPPDLGTARHGTSLRLGMTRYELQDDKVTQLDKKTMPATMVQRVLTRSIKRDWFNYGRSGKNSRYKKWLKRWGQ